MKHIYRVPYRTTSTSEHSPHLFKTSLGIKLMYAPPEVVQSNPDFHFSAEDIQQSSEKDQLLFKDAQPVEVE